MMEPIRLNKFLAERLGVSRREADDLITSGKILINEKKAELGEKVAKNDKVCYNKKIVPFETEFSYLAFNKPVGYVCSRKAQGQAATLYELLPAKYRHLKTVGRLDKDSSGLILLTNDGDFAFQMTHPKFHKQKIYEVELDKTLQPLHQQMISDYGVTLDDGPSKFTVIKGLSDASFSRDISGFANPETYIPDATEKVAQRATFPGSPVYDVEGEQVHLEKRHSDSPAIYTVILSEGRNRQIRRTFAALGYRVVKLHRISFGKYQLGNLAPGQFEEFKI